MLNKLISPEYFHRDYENDLPPVNGKDQAKDYFSQAARITSVALPFISLYRPIGKPLAIVTGLSRACTSIYQCISFSSGQSSEIAKSLLDTTLAVASVAGTVFLHPVGMLIASGHDIGFNVYRIYGAIKNRDTFEAMKQTLQMANNTFYLFTMMYVSLELQIASLSIQVIVGSVSSISQFKKGNWLEGSADLLMAAIRVNQVVPQVQQLKRKWEIEAAIKRVFVGELHEKWQFPSDHLPVGVEVDGVKIVSWNVLNNAYMEWVTDKDSQGLNGSMISDLNVKIQPDGLTVRDLFIVKLINSMMSSSKDMIALQECGTPFLTKLQESLPQNWKLIRSSEGPTTDQEVILYNSSMFTYRADQSEVSYQAYPSVPGNPIQNAYFERLGQNEKAMRIVNAHIPGNPNLPCREEFARYVQKCSSPDEIMVALGDNNFERHEMLDAYQKAGLFDFTLHSPWQTNIDPYTKESKAIDHIFVRGAASRTLQVDEVLNEESQLQETIDLLQMTKY